MRYLAIFFSLMLLPLTGCDKAPPYDPYYFLNPRLPVVMPIKLDRAGATYSMEFWVVPEHERAPWTAIFARDPSYKEIWVRGFFLGFRAVLPADADSKELDRVRNALAFSELPLEIRLTRIDTPTNKKMQLHRWQESSPEGTHGSYVPLTSDLVRKHTIANSDTAKMLDKNLQEASKRYIEIEVASTTYKDVAPGHYRYELKVVGDNPALANMTIELMSANHRQAK
jgi:hypothetical protein